MYDHSTVLVVVADRMNNRFENNNAADAVDDEAGRTVGHKTDADSRRNHQD